MADIIKVDFRATSRETQEQLAAHHKKAGKQLLAEKVETIQEFERARNLGFDLFQGFFFSKPVLLQGQHVSAMNASVIRLLAELQAADINFNHIESLIKCDVSLTYKLLRYVNSALFARSNPISHIRAALIALGESDIRRWIVLATLLHLSPKDSKVLAVHALVRARFCESLAKAAAMRSSSNAFMVGMFSLLDALAHRPLPELLGELKLPPEIVEPLLGKVEGSIAFTLELAKSYEAGDWSGVSEHAARLAIPQPAIAKLYLDAVNWAATTLNGVEATPGGSSQSSAAPAGQSAHSESLRALQQTLATKSSRSKSVSEPSKVPGGR